MSVGAACYSRMDSRKFAAIGAGIAVALAGMCVSLPATWAGEGSPERAELEQPVKDFKLTDLLGEKQISLNDLKDRVVVLMWYSPVCGICPMYDQRVREFVEAYKDKHVSLLGVSSNASDNPADVREYARANHFSFPMLRDADSSVANYFGIESTGTFLVIDRRRKLRYRGAFDDNPNPGTVFERHLELAVDAVLSGKEVPQSETFSLG